TGLGGDPRGRSSGHRGHGSPPRAATAFRHRSRSGLSLRPVASRPMPATDMDQIVNLCKRRGFVFPSAEIYGGFRSTYDYGPLGSLMLRHVKDAWIRSMVQRRDDVVLIDAAILGPPA